MTDNIDESIKKFPLRFRVRAEAPGRVKNLDEMIVDFLTDLRSLGGNAEWLRNAIREQYIREHAVVDNEARKSNV